MKVRRRSYGLVGSMMIALWLAIMVAACGGGSSTPTASPSSTLQATPTPSPSSTAGQIEAITVNWEAFFSGSTPAARKIELLQNGQQFAQIIRAQASSPISKATTARVSDVRVLSPATATVTYSILQGGQVALADQTGEAVLEDGVWKVAAETFAALLALEGVNVSPSPSSTP